MAGLFTGQFVYIQFPLPENIQDSDRRDSQQQC